MRRAWDAFKRHDGLSQILIVLCAVWAYELARMMIHPNWPVARTNAQRVDNLERVQLRLGAIAPARVPRRAGARRGDESLLFHRTIRAHCGLFRVALSPFPGRVPELPQRLPRGPPPVRPHHLA